MNEDDPDYDNRFAAQLAALSQVNAVRLRLLPTVQRECLCRIIRSFMGLQLAEAIERVAEVGFSTWQDELLDRVENGSWKESIIMEKP